MSRNPFSLAGKKVLVTGASSGIGRAIALECSRMGATMVVTGRNEARLASALAELHGGGHTSVVADLTDQEHLEALAMGIEPLDGLVLAAGVNKTIPLKMLSHKNMEAIFETNFFSQVELLRFLLKKKKLNEGASIVAIASIGGVEAFSPAAGAYGASKAALLSIMKTAAKELAPKYRVNVICPGQVNTPMNESLGITEEQYESYRQSLPLKRFGEPEDVAMGAVYLLSEASKWMTGSSLVIDGGATL